MASLRILQNPSLCLKLIWDLFARLGKIKNIYYLTRSLSPESDGPGARRLQDGHTLGMHSVAK